MLVRPLELDTSIAVAIMRGDADAASFLSASPETYLCDVVVGELYFGAYRSDHREANLQRVAEFISRFEVICGSLRAAQERNPQGETSSGGEPDS